MLEMTFILFFMKLILLDRCVPCSHFLLNIIYNYANHFSSTVFHLLWINKPIVTF